MITAQRPELDPLVFQTPPAAFRAAPLWSWNARLKPDELRRQIEELARGGCGGFFMHPRPGLETPFLSPEWFEAVRLCVAEAARHGMAAWIYDECSYPSGFAGGLVPERYPELRAKALTCHVAGPGDPPPPLPRPGEGEHVATFIARPSPGRPGVLRDYRRLDPGQSPAGVEPAPDEVQLVFAWRFMAPQTWFNDSAYVDTLDPQTARAFLEVAYEPYAAAAGEHLGRTIPGAFSDEPHFRPFATGTGEVFSWPWTPRLPEAFAAFSREAGASGDLIGRLPELAFDLEETSASSDPPAALRYRFWGTVARLFYEAFCRPIGEWCARHGLVWTGHCWEHELGPRFTGSLMLPLAAMQMPGIDLLGPDRPLGKLPGLEVQRQAGHAQMVKVASSIAHQLGRPRVLSETYGGGGWDLSLEGQKRMAEWQAVLGVNFLNPHLVHYSLRGYRKRDHPPSFLDLDPWWPEFPILQTYLARLHYALAQGRYRAELAVVHPITSTWLSRPAPLRSLPAGVEAAGLASSTDPEADRRLAKTLDSLAKDLLAAQWGFDFLDEPLVPELARAEGQQLVAGEMRYDALVIPPCHNLASATVALVEALLAAGCPVYAVAPLPERVDSRPAPELNALWPRVHVCGGTASLLEALAAAHPRAAVVRDAPAGVEVYAHVRDLDAEQGGEQVIYLFNAGEGEAQAVVVELPGAAGKVVEAWDLATGERRPVALEPVMPPVVRLDFARGQSHLLVVRGPSSMQQPAASPSRVAARQVIALSERWRLRRATPNVLVLDRACFRWDDTPWSEPLWLPEVQARVRAHLGWDNHQFREVHPWRKFASRPPRQAGGTLALRFRAVLDARLPAAARAGIRLALEDAGRWQVLVNGEPAARLEGHWLSSDLALVAAGPRLRAGENWIELRGPYAEDAWLEAIYLLGDFAVEAAAGSVRPGAAPPGAAAPPAGPAAVAHPGAVPVVSREPWRIALAPDGWPPLVLTAMPEELRGGPWVAQGLPLFGGRLVAAQTIVLDAAPAEAWLELDDLPCAALRVRCNGAEAGVIAWRPYRCALRGLLRAGENDLEIEAAATLRNVLGPLHADVRAAPLVTPSHFLPGLHWEEAYVLAPEGLPVRGKLLLAWPERLVPGSAAVP
jgi:hypothetical protein